MALVEINLLAKQQASLSRLNRASVVVAAVTGTIIGLELLVGVFLLSTKAIRAGEEKKTEEKTTAAQTEIKKLDQQSVDQYGELSLTDAVKMYQSQIGSADKLIAEHKYFTLYLSEITLNTPPTVVYASFSSSGSNQIAIAGAATTYSEVSKLAESFKNLTFAKSVSIQDAKQQTKNDKSSIQFTLSIELKSAKELNLLPKPGDAGGAPNPAASGKPLPVGGQ